MDISPKKDWKKTLGFPINYESGHSSEDDHDSGDVVMRHPRRMANVLLEDGGDGAEADLLGTTPPRARIRNKEKRRNVLGSGMILKLVRENRRNTTNDLFNNTESPLTPDRFRKRLSLKLARSKERDIKQAENKDKADSLPSPSVLPTLPTLVESCSRFKCLSSRLKSSRNSPDPLIEQLEQRDGFDFSEDLPESRVNFHNTFSMLINMGNIEKGCRRTISREEQVWQNELKDMIWLELQAKIAGRTITQQDAYLCAQRNIVPTLIQNIISYRFINDNPCNCSAYDSNEKSENKKILESNNDTNLGCLKFDCEPCSSNVGNALREVGTLLDSFYNAVSLYPSSQAMRADHKLIATKLFENRIKAMTQWYNIASFLRLILVAIKRVHQSLRSNNQPIGILPSVETEVCLAVQDCQRQKDCQVRFNLDHALDSNNGSSSNSDTIKDPASGNYSDEPGGQEVNEEDKKENKLVESADRIRVILKESNHSNPQTPEIVISDSINGTSDTTTSNESGYSSEHDKHHLTAFKDDIYDIGSLEDLTMLRLLDKCEISPYREHHKYILKTQGVRRCMMFVNKTKKFMLNKVIASLEKPEMDNSHVLSDDDEYGEEVKENNTGLPNKDAKLISNLRRYGVWSEEAIAMQLPSYRNHFILLSTVCMEAVHDYLSLKLESNPVTPSCLTIKQLIHELKEGLDIASEMRASYARHIEAALRLKAADPMSRADLLLATATFDQTTTKLVQQYLSYLRTMSLTDSLSRQCLDNEWRFTTTLAERVPAASALPPDTFTDIACNQLNRIYDIMEEKFKSFNEKTKTPEYDRYVIFCLCRTAQNIYASQRDPLLQAAGWARSFASRLPAHSHKMKERIFNSLMLLRDCISQHCCFILEKCKLLGSSEDTTQDLHDGVSARIRELLLQIYKMGFELHKELYKYFNPTSTNEMRHVGKRPVSLQPLRRPNISHQRRRPETIIVNDSVNPMIHKELHRFINDPLKLKNPANRLRLNRSESVTEDQYLDNAKKQLGLSDQLPTNIELLLSDPEHPTVTAPPAPVEDDGAATVMEAQCAAATARAIIDFAKCWMIFVMERCDRGRGLRPRWASQGLEFLMLACDPHNTKHLSEDEFEGLKQKMDECISHVVGRVTPEKIATPPRLRPRIPSPMSSNSNLANSYSKKVDNKEVPTPPTPPPMEPEPLLSFQPSLVAHSRRVTESIHSLDKDRDRRLRDHGSIGRVVEIAVASYEPKLRQVTFKWQRGLKIGQGSFGKVYTVVNTESGQLLAMKEICIAAGDRRSMQRAANELQVLEGVIHPHLVRYYGCEVHREEMLIFMELCVEGSLEGLLAGTGALGEQIVRRYTKQLISAICELHLRNIAHRDIKSGNIFLTNEGHCLKLGDFGCAIKIRANSTAPGELQGYVGTQAYMAPEVFMKSSGHGRAADVWSLGCVVTEMASGKRPFPECDSNYQIMFVVGMGGRAEIPSSLSEEGQQFCLACLTHEPDMRPKADQLTQHHFLMVKSDDDCECKPAFLMT